ncbi:hypothetical protein HJC23_002529 [Cyclotella cryptica]|uniref:EF-hand domain-containing protein n=1 Tax=Cyclotella cryptica TaxID=29204 RepID=A0ABD3QVW2_9STRA
MSCSRPFYLMAAVNMVVASIARVVNIAEDQDTEGKVTCVGTNDVTEPMDNKQEQSKDGEMPVAPMTKIKVAVVILTTVAAVSSYFVAFLVTTAMAAPVLNLTTLAVAAGVCVTVTPFVWINEWKLIRYPALRRTINALRHEVTVLNKEINFLNMEVLELEIELERMEEETKELQDITKMQDKNIDELVDLVKENQQILEEMRDYLRQAVLQDIIKLILRSDVDRDGMLNKVEAKTLEFNLKLSLDAYGIVFDTDKFYRAIGLSPSLVNVITIVKRLLPDQTDELSSSNSIGTEDEEDTDSDEDNKDDAYDMFYIPVERESRMLCPDTLRLCNEYFHKMGRRPTLMSLAPTESWRRSLRRLRCDVGLGGCDCDEES